MVKFYSFLSLKVSCEQPYFHIGMGSSPLTGKFQEEPNEPIMTFLTTPPPSILNEFAFKSHLQTQNGLLKKLMVLT